MGVGLALANKTLLMISGLRVRLDFVRFFDIRFLDL